MNVASTAGTTGYPYTAAYTASKHALVGLTRALALETRKLGITVNAVCPGWADTAMTDESVRNIVKRTGRTPGEARETLAAMNPSGRLVRPEEVAAVVLRLVGDGAAGISGEAIAIDGGVVPPA